MPKHLSFYGSHDSSICFCPTPGEYRIYEFERLLKKRYCNLSREDNWREHVLAVKQLIENEYGNQEWGSLFYGQVPDLMLAGLKEIFGFQHTEELSHHLSHAAGALYQSPFEKALIISYDSGGNEMESGVETFCIFTGDRGQPMNHTITRLANIPLDAAGAFTLLAVPISEITKEDFYSKYLSYAGKCMGLAAFGNIHHDWLDAFTAYYYRPINMESIERLGNEIGLNFSTINTISGQTAYDVAATSQFIFEQVVINAIMPFVERYQLPVILTGGGALNVLLNERLRTMLPYPVFVPVNPNDCGLSFGMMCLRNPPTRTVTPIYNGVNILDVGELPQFVEKYGARRVTVKELARILCTGKIVGVMRDNSECGPRALGNRSILCWPGDPGMKDRLNTMKQRECYDDQTQILTKNGWKLFKDISDNEEVATLNPENNELVYQGIIRKMEYDYDGNMVAIQNKRIDLLVTPEHKLWAIKIPNHSTDYKKLSYEFIEANNIVGKYHVQLKAVDKWEGIEQEYFMLPKLNGGYPVKQIDHIPMDLFLEFLGYYLADGCFTYDKGHHNIYICKRRTTRGFDKINKCLNEMYTWYYTGKVFRLSNKQLFEYVKQFGKASNKHIPQEFMNLSTRQLKILFDALMLCDGTYRPYQYKYTTVSKRFADNVQELGIKLGYSVTTSKEIRIHPKHNDVYYVRLNTYSKVSHVKEKRSQFIPYKGKVYCAEVPKYNILCIKRNEKVAFSGNSFRPLAPIVRAEDVETYFNFQGESPFMSFAPTVREPYKAKIPAVVHQDGTARVQTIRKDQNDFLHNLLSYVDVINDIGILLNTSFNIKGKPILTTIEDAIDVWLTTELDVVYIEGWLFEK